MSLQRHSRFISTPHGSPIHYLGPSSVEGTQPAVIYFALSAQTSLFEDPINQPALRLSQAGIRVFSWDLPFHTYGDDPHAAMRRWAEEFVHNPSFLFDFLTHCQQNIDYLFEQKLIDPNRFAVVGLSRGAFIATHLAAKDSRLKTVLGFAPMTKPKIIEEDKPLFSSIQEKLNLASTAENLITTPLRFYIGNHDSLVGTDACYAFITTLTTTAFNKGVRSPQVELILYPSIGFKGHGTPPFIFYDGADWMIRRFQKGEAT